MKITDKFESLPGVYIITCLKNGKQYVGESVDMKGRMYKHKCPGEKQTIPFKEDLELYGWDEFDIYVEYLRAFDKESLIDLEEQLIIRFNTLAPNGYNAQQRGNIRNHTIETRNKISESTKGRKVTEETRAKLSEAGKGKRHTEESRKKMSEAQRGNKKTHGYRHTEETRKKMSESKKGNKNALKKQNAKPKIDSIVSMR